MQISFLLHTSPRLPGGGAKIIYEYANYLVGQGHNVTLYYMANQILSKFHLPERLRKIGAKVIILKRPSWFKLHPAINKIPVFEVNDYAIKDGDVIIATDVRTAYPVCSLSAKKGKKVYFIQDYENWSLPDKEVCNTYSLGMKNITVAKWLAELVNQYANVPATIVSNAIDTNLFKVDIPIEKRERYTIAFHYRSNVSKGCEFAIETIRILEKKYPELKVIVVGIEKEPRNLPACCTYIYNATQKQVARVNNEVSIFMCSSVQEGFGLPGLEAMACGCALVASEYTGVFEYAKNEVTALLSPVKNAEMMAKNIERLFEDDEFRILIAKRGAKIASQRSLFQAAKKFESVLTDD